MLGPEQVWGHILGAKAGLEYQSQGLKVLGSRNRTGTEARPSDLSFHFPHQVQQFVQFCHLHSWTLLHFLPLLLLCSGKVYIGEEW